MEAPALYTRQVLIESTKSVDQFHTFELSVPNKDYTHCVGISFFAGTNNGSPKQLEYNLEIRENGLIRMALNEINQNNFDFSLSTPPNNRFMKIEPFSLERPALLRIKSLIDTSLASSNTSQYVKVMLQLIHEKNLCSHE